MNVTRQRYAITVAGRRENSRLINVVVRAMATNPALNVRKRVKDDCG